MRNQSSPPDRGVPRESAKAPGLAPLNSISKIHGLPCPPDMVVRVGASLTLTMDVDHFLGAITTELGKDHGTGGCRSSCLQLTRE